MGHNEFLKVTDKELSRNKENKQMPDEKTLAHKSVDTRTIPKKDKDSVLDSYAGKDAQYLKNLSPEEKMKLIDQMHDAGPILDSLLKTQYVEKKGREISNEVPPQELVNMLYDEIDKLPFPHNEAIETAFNDFLEAREESIELGDFEETRRSLERCIAQLGSKAGELKDPKQAEKVISLMRKYFDSISRRHDDDKGRGQE